MRSYLLSIIIICGALFIAPIYATIYKWVDKQGNVHFSDRPAQGADEVELPPLQTYQSNTNSAPVENNTPTKESSYQYVNIIEPQNEATVRNNEGSVNIILNMEPKLLPTHKVMVLLDGQMVGSPQTNMTITLTNIDRGTHKVAVQIIDEKGHSVAQSDEIIFHLHRPKQNSVKPLLPNKPNA